MKVTCDCMVQVNFLTGRPRDLKCSRFISTYEPDTPSQSQSKDLSKAYQWRSGDKSKSRAILVRSSRNLNSLSDDEMIPVSQPAQPHWSTRDPFGHLSASRI
ncbi:hypothetical protein AVEN_171952-1 [Araneus ventricosus]|uniref:Uncharacterized protein n=1 Tax=Araneus ventricosus TaxID=182803 RepID=A0A4Y2RZH5_ARAVE|nr:hypothetical protein AVEN_171952-1 [Araneus ventricosus]